MSETYWKNIQDYGANPSSPPIVNTEAIHSAVASMKSGDVLVIPPGVFDVHSLFLRLPDRSSLFCFGILNLYAYSFASGIVIGGDGKDEIIGCYIWNLRISKRQLDYTSKVTGLVLKNICTSFIDIASVTDFGVGVEVRAEDEGGFAYNEIHLRDISNNRHNLKLTTENGGWCNENSFYGGRFDWASDAKWAYPRTHISIPRSSNCNRFYSPSFEGITEKYVYAIRCDGHDNYFFAPRFEMRGRGLIEFQRHSRHNVIFHGYNVRFLMRDTKVIDKGWMNQVYGHRIMDYLSWGVSKIFNF